MNLPNALTLLRIFFVPLLVALLVQENLALQAAGFQIANEWLALLIFWAAALTDLLDGYLARRWHQITTVGTLLDPIADKLLVSAALISLVQVHVVPAWMVVIVVGREFAISGLRSIAAAEGYIIKASDLGKTKLVTQVVAITLLVMSIHWKFLNPVALLAMWSVVIFASISAVLYFRKFWKEVDTKIKLRRRQELLDLQRLQRKRQRAASRHAAAAD